jgi:hypothetical protein
MPSKPTTTANQHRFRRAKAGDIAQLRAVLWGVLLQAEQIALDPNQHPDLRLKAVGSLATISGVYLKATQQGDLEKRIEVLEQGTAPTPERGLPNYEFDN